MLLLPPPGMNSLQTQQHPTCYYESTEQEHRPDELIHPGCNPSSFLLSLRVASA